MEAHFYMTDDEIRTRWNNRILSEARMVRCLADQNVCSNHDMRNKLVELGLVDPNRALSKGVYSEEDRAAVVAMYMEGADSKEIAKALNRAEISVRGLLGRMKTSGEIQPR